MPLINIVLSHVKDQKHTGAVSGILTTMIQVGISIGIALIGSIFFGMVASGYNTVTTTHVDSNISMHYYNNALVSSMLYTISFVIATLFLVFLLPSRSHKEKYQQA